LALLLIITACGGRKAEDIIPERFFPESFEIVSNDFINKVEIVTIRHRKTGCHFVYSYRDSGAYGVSVGSPQQILNPEGKPYCD
jgi:hypothetical protein